MTDKSQLDAEIDAAMATVKAKIAAGIEIHHPGFDGTKAQRLEWIVFKGMNLDPAKRRRVCNLPPLDQNLFAEAVARAELEQIKRRAENLTAPQQMLPELKRIKDK